VFLLLFYLFVVQEIPPCPQKEFATEEKAEEFFAANPYCTVLYSLQYTNCTTVLY